MTWARWKGKRGDALDREVCDLCDLHFRSGFRFAGRRGIDLPSNVCLRCARQIARALIEDES